MRKRCKRVVRWQMVPKLFEGADCLPPPSKDKVFTPLIMSRVAASAVYAGEATPEDLDLCRLVCDFVFEYVMRSSVLVDKEKQLALVSDAAGELVRAVQLGRKALTANGITLLKEVIAAQEQIMEMMPEAYIRAVIRIIEPRIRDGVYIAHLWGHSAPSTVTKEK